MEFACLLAKIRGFTSAASRADGCSLAGNILLSSPTHNEVSHQMASQDASYFYEDDPELAENQPIRLSGLVSLGFGLLSIISFVGPYLWAVPAFAIVMGLVAIRPAKGLYVGKTFASIGICLGLFLGSWAIVRHNHLHNLRVDRVTEFALHWLDSFKYNQPEFSFEMTQVVSARQYKVIDLQKYYQKKIQTDRDAPEEELQDTMTYEKFLNKDVIRQLFDAGDKPKWRLKKIIREHKMYTLRFYVMVFEDTTGTVADVELSMQRTRVDRTTVSYWQVESYEFAADDIEDKWN